MNICIENTVQLLAVTIKISNISQRNSLQILSQLQSHLLLHSRRNRILPRRDIPRLRLDLHQLVPARTTALSICVNALRMTTISLATARALPDVLVLDLVVVLGRHFDLPSIDRMILHILAALPSPSLETCPVRIVGDIGDHVIGQMTVFVRDSVDEPILVVDNPFCQFDRGMVCVDGAGRLVFHIARTDSLRFPACTASSLEKSLGPDDFDTASCLGQFGDFASRDRIV